MALQVTKVLHSQRHSRMEIDVISETIICFDGANRSLVAFEDTFKRMLEEMNFNSGNDKKPVHYYEAEVSQDYKEANIWRKNQVGDRERIVVKIISKPD